MIRQARDWMGLPLPYARSHTGWPRPSVAPALAFLGAFMFLSGCTNVLPAIAIFQGAVDRVVSKGEQVDDNVLTEIEAAETFLAEEVKRLARAKCKMPFTALVRYALSSPERSTGVTRDCNLVVTGGAVMVSPSEAVVPEAKAVEPRG